MQGFRSSPIILTPITPSPTRSIRSAMMPAWRGKRNRRRGDSSSECWGKRVAELTETRRLLEVVHELRQKCPWDRKQTHRSLIPYLLEEAYETVDAIKGRDPGSLREELGDLLLQVVLHAELSRE